MFYVYEHVRLDSGAVFYVGKGSGARSGCTQGRNPHWCAVAAKHGWSPRIVFRTDDEELSFLAEQELIVKHRRMGSPLTNLTDGGEGMAGYSFDPEVAKQRMAYRCGVPNVAASRALKGVPKSPEHRRRLSESKMGRKATDEARRRMSESRKGRPSAMKGKRHKQSSKDAISAALRGELNPFYGRQHSAESLNKMSEAHKGSKRSVESRMKQSASVSGSKNHRFGKKIPEGQKARQRAALMARPKIQCPHCHVIASEGNAKRWHLDNCRNR